MAVISPPYDMLALENGQELSFHVVRYESGTLIIHPVYPGAPDEKEVRGLRIYVRTEDKPYLPSYWDITPQHLVVGLEPLLRDVQGTDRTVTLKAFLTRPGDPASKRFSIKISP